MAQLIDYVDNIFIIGTDQFGILPLKHLSNKLQTKDFGILCTFWVLS